jgi:hypothetical protein
MNDEADDGMNNHSKYVVSAEQAHTARCHNIEFFFAYDVRVEKMTWVAHSEKFRRGAILFDQHNPRLIKLWTNNTSSSCEKSLVAPCTQRL